MMDRKPRILGVLPAVVPSAIIYLIKPLQHMQAQGLVEFEYVEERSVTLKQIRASDLIIFSRNLDPKYGFVLDEARSLHIPTVYDIDDNFWAFSRGSYRDRQHNFRPRDEQREEYLKNADLVRTFNPRMTRLIADKFNKNVGLYTAGIDFGLVSVEPLPRKDQKIRINYATGRGVTDELISLFSDDLKQILRLYPEQVEMVFWGQIPVDYLDFPNVSAMDVIYDYDRYIRTLATSGFDIGLAPLILNEEYLSKTNTKFRDYGACRIPGIYTDADIYSDYITDGQTGLLVKQAPGVWFDAMQRLILDEPLRERIRENAYQYVYDHYRQELMEQEWWDLIQHMVISPVDGQVKDLVERSRVYTGAAPHEVGQTNLYLGGSGEPLPGFIAVHPRRCFPGGVVAEFDHLPFTSHSVNLVVVDHALDDSEAISDTMEEIYRVCTDRAQVSLTASYAQQTAHLGNPERRRSIFNEHTPRYWTDQAWSNVSPREYADPPGPVWGLGGSHPGKVNFACLRTEFFYYPAYREKAASEKRLDRKRFWDVCDEIVYHLLVLKSPVEEEEMRKNAAALPYFEPAHVTNRRFQETIDQLRTEIENLEDQLNTLKNERDSFHVLWQNTEAQRIHLAEEINRLEREQQNLRTSEQDTGQVEGLARQLSAYRGSRIQHWNRRLRDRYNAAADPAFASAYPEMIIDSQTVLENQGGFVLQPGEEIQSLAHKSYTLHLTRPGLHAIGLAFLLDYPLQQGEVGIEIASSSPSAILCNIVVPASQITEHGPTIFRFDPLAGGPQGAVELRVFARGVKFPIRLYEWRKYSLGGFGKIIYKPFISLSFD